MRHPLICALLFCFLSTVLQAQPNFPYTPFLDSDYEIGATYKLFGDKVTLRSAATTDSKGLGVYPIGTSVKLLERTAETYFLYGVNSNWYKVEIAGNTGFIVGAFLASQHIEKDESNVYINYELIKGTEEYIPYTIVVRIPVANGFNEHKYKMPNGNYAGAKLSGNRGFSELDQIISLEFYAESCGATGGEMHLLLKNNAVIKELSTFYVSDAGVFSYEETAIFPNDPGGMQEMIIYTEITEELNGKNIYEISGQKSLLIWENNKLSPMGY